MVYSRQLLRVQYVQHILSHLHSVTILDKHQLRSSDAITLTIRCILNIRPLDYTPISSQERGPHSEFRIRIIRELLRFSSDKLTELTMMVLEV